jgi:hypothetical protein
MPKRYRLSRFDVLQLRPRQQDAPLFPGNGAGGDNRLWEIKEIVAMIEPMKIQTDTLPRCMPRPAKMAMRRTNEVDLPGIRGRVVCLCL